MKVVTIVGARPQFVKAAVVSEALWAGGIEEVLVHTGQHYDLKMSQLFFDELGLRPPTHNLGIGSAPHGMQTGQMLSALEPVLAAERPDIVIVYGDTNSTLAGALAAAKLHVPVAHVEAGLRSFNRRMPEEINRVLVDHLGDVLFAPTRTAVENLRHEGIADARILQIGDVMMDAAFRFAAVAESNGIAPRRWGLDAGSYVLATVHRAENTDEPGRLRAIFDGLATVAADMPVVLPLHPRTRARLGADEVERYGAALRVIDPVGYLEMLVLEKNARLIATDSGGVQKEAFFFQVPCVTLRDETEWTETVALGGNLLLRPESAASVANGIRDRLSAPAPPQTATSLAESPFGDGNSAQRIAAHLSGLDA